jgi:hypothetical protein
MLEITVLRRVYGPKRQEKEEWETLNTRILTIFTFSQHLVG